jgi:hypothetical protein
MKTFSGLPCLTVHPKMGISKDYCSDWGEEMVQLRSTQEGPRQTDLAGLLPPSIFISSNPLCSVTFHTAVLASSNPHIKMGDSSPWPLGLHSEGFHVV